MALSTRLSATARSIILQLLTTDNEDAFMQLRRLSLTNAAAVSGIAVSPFKAYAASSPCPLGQCRLCGGSRAQPSLTGQCPQRHPLGEGKTSLIQSRAALIARSFFRVS